MTGGNAQDVRTRQPGRRPPRLLPTPPTRSSAGCRSANSGRRGHEFCKAHHTRWRQDGFRDLEEFVADCERFGQAVIDFCGLGPQLKLELQYAVQCRRDAQASSCPWAS